MTSTTSTARCARSPACSRTAASCARRSSTRSRPPTAPRTAARPGTRTSAAGSSSTACTARSPPTSTRSSPTACSSSTSASRSRTPRRLRRIRRWPRRSSARPSSTCAAGPAWDDRRVITRAEVDLAAARIAGRVRVTPVVEVDAGAVWFKLELLQHTGTFKARGAFNRVLSARESGELDDRVGIVVASGGNAGLANAHVAAALGVPATVFVPATAPAVKVARLRTYGATVVQVGGEYAEAYEAAVEHATQAGAVYVHAYDQPDVAAGAGVCGAELLAQVAVDTIVVAVGGGGLMAGIAAAAEGVAQVVAVEPDTCPTLHTALARGRPVDVPVSGIAADSLGARRIG